MNTESLARLLSGWLTGSIRGRKLPGQKVLNSSSCICSCMWNPTVTCADSCLRTDLYTVYSELCTVYYVICIVNCVRIDSSSFVWHHARMFTCLPLPAHLVLQRTDQKSSFHTGVALLKPQGKSKGCLPSEAYPHRAASAGSNLQPPLRAPNSTTEPRQALRTLGKASTQSRAPTGQAAEAHQGTMYWKDAEPCVTASTERNVLEPAERCIWH